VSRFLFIHGVYHGPECWDDVARELRRRGNRCQAVSLRGHALEERGRFDTRGVGFREYLADVRAALLASGPGTILVGHSLGGMLARALESHAHVRGTVFVCTPTAGSLRSGVRILLRRFPLPTLRFLLTLRAEVLYHEPHIVSHLFWSSTPDEVPDPRWIDQALGFREPRRLFLDVLRLRQPPVRSNTPRLVVAGGRDFTLSAADMRRLANELQAPLRIIEDAPHDLMSTHPNELAVLLDRFATSSGAGFESKAACDPSKSDQGEPYPDSDHQSEPRQAQREPDPNPEESSAREEDGSGDEA
jgi:pimeloyl-ACP methyl ester carboxylesterase